MIFRRVGGQREIGMGKIHRQCDTIAHVVHMDVLEKDVLGQV